MCLNEGSFKDHLNMQSSEVIICIVLKRTTFMSSLNFESAFTKMAFRFSISLSCFYGIPELAAVNIP